MRDTPLNGRVFAPVLLALGLAMIVRTIVAGGAALSLGVILGVLFAALGALRLYATIRGSRPRA